jgi:hypothetical protein
MNNYTVSLISLKDIWFSQDTIATHTNKINNYLKTIKLEKVAGSDKYIVEGFFGRQIQLDRGGIWEGQFTDKVPFLEVVKLNIPCQHYTTINNKRLYAILAAVYAYHKDGKMNLLKPRNPSKNNKAKHALNMTAQNMEERQILRRESEMATAAAAAAAKALAEKEKWASQTAKGAKGEEKEEEEEEEFEGNIIKRYYADSVGAEEENDHAVANSLTVEDSKKISGRTYVDGIWDSAGLQFDYDVSNIYVLCQVFEAYEKPEGPQVGSVAMQSKVLGSEVPVSDAQTFSNFIAMRGVRQFSFASDWFFGVPKIPTFASLGRRATRFSNPVKLQNLHCQTYKLEEPKTITIPGNMPFRIVAKRGKLNSLINTLKKKTTALMRAEGSKKTQKKGRVNALRNNISNIKRQLARKVDPVSYKRIYDEAKNLLRMPAVSNNSVYDNQGY